MTHGYIPFIMFYVTIKLGCFNCLSYTCRNMYLVISSADPYIYCFCLPYGTI